MNGIDEGVINYAIYEDGNRYLGIATVEMPNKTSKSFTMNGAGIAGDIDIPVIGHREAMTMKINFRDTSEAAYALAEERVHLIDLRVVHQNLDSAAGEIGISGHKFVAKIFPKSLSGGTLSPASPQAVSGEYSVLSIAEYIDGKCVSDIDPVNFKDVDHTGKDRAEAIRKALGLQ